MHYLVTGGSGFVGRNVVQRLVEEKHDITSFDNGFRGRTKCDFPGANRVKWVDGDVCDRTHLSSEIAGVDSVLHFAFINGTDYFYSKSDLVIEVALKGIMNVLDACVEHGIKELILVSSSEVYQEAEVIPTDETVPYHIPDPLNPRYSYAIGKIASECAVLNYAKHFDRVCIVRPCNVYGPDMGDGHVVPQFIRRMQDLCMGARAWKDGMIEFPIQGTGEETRSFTYISDFVDGFMKVLEKGETKNIYHVGTDVETPVKEIVKELWDWYSKRYTFPWNYKGVRIVPGSLLLGSPVRRCPNIDKIRKLGYEPKVTLKEGLRRILECQTKQ